MRREDAHKKIQLGGLVIKAGLADQPAAVILGALVMAAAAIATPDGQERLLEYQQAGDAAFRG